MSIYGQFRFAGVLVIKFTLQYRSQFNYELSAWFYEVCILYLSLDDAGDVTTSSASKLFG